MKRKVLYYAILWGTVELGSAKPRAGELPRALVIGDSISIGYTPYVAQMLTNRVVVVHNPGNAMHTRNGLAKLSDWLGTSRWDVIVFNFGLHDLKYVHPDGQPARTFDDGARQVPPEEYARNLAEIGRRLCASGATVIFATTTPFPSGVSPPRNPADVELYNRLAREALQPLGIRILDLTTLVQFRLSDLQRPANVHFRPEGDRVLGEAVARAIWEALAHDLNELNRR